MKPISDALELLTAQHEAISVDLTTLDRLSAGERARTLGVLADQIATHLAVEEQFLATLGMVVPTRDNDELRAAVAELLITDVTSPELGARLAAFAQRWEAHTESQDHAMFIALAEVVEPSVLSDIGAQLGTWSESSRCLAA